MKVWNHPIPAHKFRQWHEILCATGGRYLRPPREQFGEIRVDYEPGDYHEQLALWRNCTEDLQEARRDSWWRKLYRRTLSLLRIA